MANNTEQELRSQISNLMADLMLQSKLLHLDSHANMIEQSKKYVETHNTRLDLIMKLIEAEATRREQALLDELETFAIERAATLNALNIGYFVASKRQAAEGR